MIVLGDSNQIKLLVDRFIQANNHDADTTNGQQILNETIHVAYSLKVLIR